MNPEETVMRFWKTADVAKRFGLSMRHLRTLCTERGFPSSGRGLHDILDADMWMLNNERRKLEEAKDRGTTLRESEERKAKLQADMLEHKLEMARGETVAIRDVIHVIKPSLTAIRSILMGIPKHAARELGSDSEAYLENFIRKALNELAAIPDRVYQFEQAEAGAEAVISNDETTSEADDQPVGRPKKDSKPRVKRGKRPVGDVESGIPTGDDGRNI